MVTMERFRGSRLYIPTNAVGPFTVGFLFADGAQTQAQIDLATAWTKGFVGFVTLPSAGAAVAFADELLAEFKASDASSDLPRIGWVETISDRPSLRNVLRCKTGPTISFLFTTPSGNTTVRLTPGGTLSFDTALPAIVAAPPPAGFFAEVVDPLTSIGVLQKIENVRIDLLGGRAGKISFTMSVSETTLKSFDIGLRYFFVDDGDPLFHAFDIFRRAAQPLTVTMHALLDPFDPFGGTIELANVRSAEGTIPSHFTTHVGNVIDFAPTAAKLVSVKPFVGRDHFIPAGTFELVVPKVRVTEHRLLCGLASTEYFKFGARDRLEFVTGGAAFVNDATQSTLLGDTHTTSYAKVLRETESTYHAQPLTAPLHRKSRVQTNFLEYHELIAARQADRVAVPLVPVAGLRADTLAGAHGLESGVLAQSRRDVLTNLAPVPFEDNALDEAIDHALTPQGFVGETTRGGWKRIVLARTPVRDTDDGPTRDGDLSIDLDGFSDFSQALQSEKLFLVMTKVPDPTKFAAKLAIRDWNFNLELPIGGGGPKGTPLMVFKFVDRPFKELIEDTRLWTSPEKFNDPAQIATIQQRLRDAVNEGAGDPLFDDLRRRTTSEKWHGLIAFDVPIGPVPSQAAGLLTAVNLKKFRAHHVGAEINRTRPNADDPTRFDIEGSSTFGLIHYVGSNMKSDAAYSFDVPQIDIRFENAAIREFRCLIDLGVHRLFDDDSTRPGGNVIQLIGRYEEHEGKDVYSFTREAVDAFKVDSKFLDSVTLRRVQFSTVSSTSSGAARKVVSRFSIWGDMKFREITPLDLVSFDALRFSNLGIILSDDNGAITFAFDPGELNFDITTSRKRGGLLGNLPLKLKGFHLGGPNGFSLPDLGFFSLNLGGGDADQQDRAKYGLSFELDLGNLGALFSKLREFRADLLFGWTSNRDGTPGKFSFGIRLPESTGGRKEIGIEGVVKITVGNFGINRVEGTKRYFIVLECCTIEVLGNKVPGKKDLLNVYLFADPQQLDFGKVGWFVGLDRLGNAPTGGFDLRYLGLGQRVTPKGAFRTFHDVLTALTHGDIPNAKKITCGDDTEDKAARERLDAQTKNGALEFRRDADWLVATDFVFGDLLEVGIVFNDPVLYSLFLSIKPIGFDFEITYRKIRDDVGLYYIDIGLPEAWRQMEFGAVSITLPFIGIGVYTNGDFSIDVGFPRNLDFTRSFQMQALPFIGYGGFYFARLSGATTTFPNLTNFNTVYQAGLALRLGLGKEFRKGILRAGLSVTFYGILEGAIAMNSTGANGGLPAKPDAYYLTGQMGVIGEIFGVVDFGIVKAAVSIRIFAGIGARLASGMATVLWIEAGVEVYVEIVLLSIHTMFIDIEIRISFSFQTHVRFSWTLGNGDSSEQAVQLAPINVRGVLEEGQPLREPLSMLDWKTPMAGYAIEHPGAPLELFFLPEMTVVRGKPQFVALLAIGDDFNALVRALARLTLHVFGKAPGDVVTAVDLEQLNRRLHLPVSLARPEPSNGEPAPPGVEGLTYEKIVEILRAHFAIAIKSVDAAPAKFDARHFPMLPPLAVTMGTKTIDFFSKEVAADYDKSLHEYFERMYVIFKRQSGSGVNALDLDVVPRMVLTKVIFQDYFDLLIKGAIDELYDLVVNGDNTDKTVTELLDLKPTWTNLGGMATRFFKHGLRLPDDPTNPASFATTALYAATAQQFEAFATDAALVLEKSTAPTAPPSDWFEVVGGKAVLPYVSKGIERLTNLDIKAKGKLERMSYLRTRAATFGIQQRMQWTDETGTRSIWTLPQALLDRLPSADKPSLAIDLRVAGSPNKFSTTDQALTARSVFATVMNVRIRRVPTKGTAFAKEVYQLEGVRETDRRLLEQLLLLSSDQRGTIRLSLAFNAAGGLQSERAQVAEHVLLIKTNLSTESNPNAFVQDVQPPPPLSASIDDPLAFLTLIQECSIVNSGGYYLRYFHDRGGCDPANPQDTCGIPASGFDAATNVGNLTLVIEYTSATPPPLFNTVVIDAGANAPDPATNIFFAELPSQSMHEVKVEPGCIGFIVDRENPATKYRIPPSLNEGAGFVTWKNLVELIRKHGVDPTKRSDALTKLLIEARSEEVEMAKGYNLLAYRIAGGTNLRPTIEALPIGPRPPDGVDEVLEPTRGDRPVDTEPAVWRYRQVLPVSTSFTGAGEKTSPYNYVAEGAKIEIGFDFRDNYGNALESNQRESLDLRYFDRLVPVSEWPGVSLRYDFAPPQKQMNVTLGFDVDLFIPKRGLTETPESFALREATAAEQRPGILAQYRRIRDQVRGAGVTATIATSLLRGNATMAVDITKVVKFVDEIVARLCRVTPTSGELAAVCAVAGPGNVDPKAVTIAVPIATPADAAKYVLSATLTIERKQSLVDREIINAKYEPAFIATTPIAPAINAKRTLDAFARAFEETFSTLKLATGEDDKSTEQVLWVVQKSLLDVARTAAVDPFFYAPRPLLNRLWSGRDVPISVTAGVVEKTLDFADIDLDVWMRQFLERFEQSLQPERAVATRVSSPAVFDALMNAKKSVAGNLADLVVPLIETTGARNDAEARIKYLQNVRIRLTSAYDIDTIVQLPVKSSSIDAGEVVPPRVYGRVLFADAAGKDEAFRLSTAKVGVGGNTLTFLFSAKYKDANSAPMLPLQYRITHLEHRIAKNGDPIEDYVPSSWLNLAVPIAVPLGTQAVPIALRAFPTPPVVTAQSATADATHPVTLATAKIWKYAFDYEYGLVDRNGQFAPVDQDALELEVLYLERKLQQFAQDLQRVPLPHALATFIVKSAEAPQGLSDEVFSQIATLIAEADWVTWRAAELASAEPRFGTDKYLLDDTLDANGCMNMTAKYDRPADNRPPTAKSIVLEPRECLAPPACGAATPNPTPTQFERRYKCPNNPPRVSRRITLGGLDALVFEQAWAGVRITRNAQLLPAKRTNRDFVYATPLVRFGNPLTPLLDTEDEIPIGNAPATMEAHLQFVFRTLFPHQASDARIKLGCRYGFSVHRAAALDTEMPIVMTPPVDVKIKANGEVDGTTLADFAADVALWTRENEPRLDASAFFIFDLTVFATRAMTGDVPVLRLRRLRVDAMNVRF
jgi:hypothetical protein